MFRQSFFIALFLALPAIAFSQGGWEAEESPLMTKWAEEVGPENALPEYPRPMMERDHWENLNGLWDFKITGKGNSNGDYEDQILVPYPVESALSGIKKTVGADNRVWYKRSFEVDNPYEDGRVLLHFGASDWETDVRINDEYVGKHRGGYDPFTFDITDQVSNNVEQEIEITVWDPTDLGSQPVGKQTHDPHSIWYTAVTGIWQTVWIEYVPESYIKDLNITPDVDNSRVKVEVDGKNLSDDHQIRIKAKDENKLVGESTGFHKQDLYISLDDPQLWTPDNPFLYDLEVELLDKNGNTVDEVSSYFGMRKINIAKAEDGHMRLFLNNEPLFHIGPLDQGWWPDGLYTAPTDAALKYDIEVTKRLGYNMLRKHVKTEPQRFYYWADKLGILVWQDMPNGDMRPGAIELSKETAKQFKKEYKNMIDAFYNHPSIVMWVPFNEGWGQLQTEEIVEWTKNYDPTRLVNNASGWTDHGVGDVIDMHAYPGPDMPEIEDNRAAVLGEYGGEALVVKDHLWVQDFSRAPDHYETSQSETQLHETYSQMMRELYDLKDNGLAAAVYTQTTDVESEVNGLMTYDREVIKFDVEELLRLHEKLIKE